MKNVEMPEFVTIDLESIYQDCWKQLTAGSLSAKHPFHCPTIATVNNGFPELRTVVLRNANEASQGLIFHTDYRSPKVKQIQNNHSVSWLFYDAQSRIQLRIKTMATVHHQDEVTKSRWVGSRSDSKKCYLTDKAPSSVIDAPNAATPLVQTMTDVSDELLEPGYENFAVVSCQVMQIDWLFLNRVGHRRARFDLNNTSPQQTWIAP